MDQIDITQAIEVMQHFAAGGKVEVKNLDEGPSANWRGCPYPAFNWADFEYRIRQHTPVERWGIECPDGGFETTVATKELAMSTCAPGSRIFLMREVAES